MVDVKELVLLPLADKNRPAIVLELRADGLARVIYGTGTARDMPRVEVKLNSRDYKALGFEKPTYFYTSGVRLVRPEVLIRLKGRRCPPELFHRLEAIAELPPA